MKQTLLIMLMLILSFTFGATIINQSDDIEVMEEQKMLIESLKKFVDDNPTAADEMEYIIQKKEDSARKKMNDMLEKMAKDEDKEESDELTGGALDYVTRKLNLALVYFYEAKYWLTVEECNNVIKVNPKNTLAWIRRGSGYYMLGKYDEAKKDWELALALKPNKNEQKDIEKFIAKIDTVQ